MIAIGSRVWSLLGGAAATVAAAGGGLTAVFGARDIPAIAMGALASVPVIVGSSIVSRLVLGERTDEIVPRALTASFVARFVITFTILVASWRWTALPFDRVAVSAAAHYVPLVIFEGWLESRAAREVP